MELLDPKFRTGTASTEGMEKLFGTRTVEGTEADQGSELVRSEAVEIISTEEAAQRLGISSRAVLKRLKTGTLKGKRDTSKKKAEWQIYWFGTTEPETTNDKNGTEPGSEHGTKGSEPLRYFMEQNAKLLEQNQALVHRNGYLEAVLAERDQQIKLLADSNQQVWWRRFTCWFFGRGQ